MKDKISIKSVRWMVTLITIVVPLAILLWFNRDVVSAFIDQAGWIRLVCDRQAVVAYLDQIGFVGPLVLMGLIGLQVLIPSLPAEPPMIAGAYAYGFTAGFLMNWAVSVAVSQAVFYLARYAGRPLVERFVPAKMLDKWTRTAGERGTVFFLLAFVIPPVPSDILIYVAGLSEIEGRRFFVANFFGRMPMIVLLTLVGAYGFSITPAMITGLTVIGVLMLVAWLYYMRERPKAGANPAQLKAGRAERSNSAAPIAPRLSLNPIPSLARQPRWRTGTRGQNQSWSDSLREHTLPHGFAQQRLTLVPEYGIIPPWETADGNQNRYATTHPHQALPAPHYRGLGAADATVGAPGGAPGPAADPRRGAGGFRQDHAGQQLAGYMQLSKCLAVARRERR